MGQEKKEITPLNIIRSETVLSRYPLHRLSNTSDGVSIEIHRSNEHGEVLFKWKVSYTNEFGQPGALAYKLDTLVINRCIDDAPRPIPRFVRLGSLRDIAEGLGLGRDTNSVKKALHQNASAYITAKVRYVTRNGKEKTAEFGKNRYGVIFAGETLSDGTIADSVYLELNDWYRDILNTARTRPLDYDYLKELPPTAQRLYELLSYRVFAALKHHREQAKYLYSEFCAFAPQTRYFDYERVKKQMYKVHSPHKKSGFIVSAEFKETTDDEGRKDWEIEYRLGPKAKTQHTIFTAKRRELTSTAGAPTAMIEQGREVEGLPTTKTEMLVAKLIEQGVDERIAAALVKEDAKEAEAQLEAFPFRKLKDLTNPAGWLIDAIRKKYTIPKTISAKAQKHRQSQREIDIKKAEEEHRERHRGVFSSYLAAKLHELERTDEEAYSAFNKRFDHFRQVLNNLEPETVENYRLYDFEQFAGGNPDLGILTFWEWDETLNSEPFVEPEIH